MSTPASGTTPYAQPSDMLNRYDARSLGKLLSDTGAEMDQGDIPTSTVLTALLQQASGLIESACVVGMRYNINPQASPPINDLAALTGNSQQLLIGLVCDLTYWYLWNRRPHRERKSELPAQVEMAFDWLDRLRNGEAIFGLLENIQASVVSDVYETPQTIAQRNGVVFQAERYFGIRADRRRYISSSPLGLP